MDTKSNDDSGGSDSLDKSMQRKCVMVETTSATSEPAAETDNCSRDSAALQEHPPLPPPPPGEPKTDVTSAVLASTESSTNTFKSSNSSSNSNNNNTTAAAASAAFETKVKLISQNLKETTLAETDTAVDTTQPSSTSNIGDNNNARAEPEDEQNSTDDCDQRVKKVRFHPDVKANDGGNRVKKKKRAAALKGSGAGGGGGDNSNQSCDGMEIDDDDEDLEDEDNDGEDDDDEDADEEEEEEEEFNLAKTIAEAEDYLKQHPLTFVRRVEQNGEQSPDGLANPEDMTPMMLDNELEEQNDSDDDFYKKCKPENGIERVLGKETKAGKACIRPDWPLIQLLSPPFPCTPLPQVEFLLRYENQGGLFWESEDYIQRMCPTLLQAYEKNRERRQQRLVSNSRSAVLCGIGIESYLPLLLLQMHHVAKRQSLRQRYTDF
ncbi:hypothetical protein KR222_001368 [Zaprionus bogoriensis]|nr:hypothetical protein KR222_001368 [Zaprionus bogoriensis]